MKIQNQLILGLKILKKICLKSLPRKPIFVGILCINDFNLPLTAPEKKTKNETIRFVSSSCICLPYWKDIVESKFADDNNKSTIRRTLKVKLKRKLSYKGYYEYQFVSPRHVKTALEFF